jgi:hypothetical protein
MFQYAKKRPGSPIVCGIGSADAGHRVATFTAGLAAELGAPLIAVRAEPPLDPGASQAAILRGHGLLTDAVSEAERDRSPVTCTVKLVESGGRTLVRWHSPPGERGYVSGTLRLDRSGRAVLKRERINPPRSDADPGTL